MKAIKIYALVEIELHYCLAFSYSTDLTALCVVIYVRCVLHFQSETTSTSIFSYFVIIESIPRNMNVICKLLVILNWPKLDGLTQKTFIFKLYLFLYFHSYKASFLEFISCTSRLFWVILCAILSQVIMS